MIAFAFVVLVLGALIATIWGKQTAQGCFKASGKILIWVLVVASCAAAPPVGIPILILGCCYQTFAVLIAWGRKNQIKEERNEARAGLQADLGLAKSALGISATSDGEVSAWKSYRVYPRIGAASAPSNLNHDFWATALTKGIETKYAVEDRTNGQTILLLPSQFFAEWDPSTKFITQGGRRGNALSQPPTPPPISSPPPASPLQQSARYCTGCGSLLGKSDHFCAACGKSAAPQMCAS